VPAETPPATPDSPARSALLAAWTTAWLAGRTGLDDVVAAVTGGEEHAVRTGDADGPAPLAWTLGRLRGAGAWAVRAVLPVPGDVVGLPGPGAFSRAALTSGEGAVVLGAASGFVPHAQVHASPFDGEVTTVRWDVHEVPETLGPALGGLPQVAEAEAALADAVRETTTALLALDVARWRPEVAGALRSLREGGGPQAGAGALPPGHPARAVRLYASAERMRTVLELAAADEGGAVVAAEARERSGALSGLGRAVHRARLAAVNAGVEELAAAGPSPRPVEHRGAFR
jgi:hypothetical protein